MQNLSETDLKLFKTRINKAFANLRKVGYTAKQNFMCCNTCAWDAMDDDSKVVFYHKQNAADLKHGICHMAWNGDGTLIASIFKDAGLYVSWDGNEYTKIRIEFTGEEFARIL